MRVAAIKCHSLLALFAEQGSGKSTAGRLIRNLVDPNRAPLRSEHREARELMIGANNSWCLAYDNLSYLPAWLSDALCRLSTGGGFATRELYTDQDEIIFDAMRPVMLTSIEEVATRSDLLDRCLVVWLPTIPEDRRRREDDIERAFAAVHGQILGALFDAVAGALQELPNTSFSHLPRMADFAAWATAAEQALGWRPGEFLEAYFGNRESANELAIESSPIGGTLLQLLDAEGSWTGSATQLLEELKSRVSEQTARQKSWPKNGRSMAGHLKRLSPNLRAAGWQIEYTRDSSQRSWSITPKPLVASSGVTQTPAAVESSAEQTDANPCDLPRNDADDAHDGNGGSLLQDAKGNWEEGEL